MYKIIDVALVALAREPFTYLAPVNKEFQFDKGIAIVAATFVGWPRGLPTAQGAEARGAEEVKIY